jgi:hypothetical protein
LAFDHAKTPMNEMGMTIVNCGDYHLSVWLHTRVNPPLEGWAEGVERVAELKRQLGGDVSKMLVLALSDGGAPNPVQRRQLFIDVLEGKSKAAALSCQLSHRWLRSIATAITWLSPNFSAFPPEQFDLALKHLELQAYHETIIGGLLELQKSVQPIETLAMVSNRR